MSSALFPGSSRNGVCCAYANVTHRVLQDLEQTGRHNQIFNKSIIVPWPWPRRSGSSKDVRAAIQSYIKTNGVYCTLNILQIALI